MRFCFNNPVTAHRSRPPPAPFNSISRRIHSTQELPFFFSHSMERESVIPSLAVIRSLYHPAPLEPRQVPPSKIGVPLSILKVNEINHPARRYIYIYTHTASSTSAALLLLLFLLSLLLLTFSQLLTERWRISSDSICLHVIHSEGQFADLGMERHLLLLKNCKNSTSVISLSRDFLILDVSSALKSSPFNPFQSPKT